MDTTNTNVETSLVSSNLHNIHIGSNTIFFLGAFCSIPFFDKGWILLAQNKVSREYKHDEHTPGLCIVRMHTANTNTHKSTCGQISKSYKTKAMHRRGKKRKLSDQILDRQTIGKTISAPTIS